MEVQIVFFIQKFRNRPDSQHRLLLFVLQGHRFIEVFLLVFLLRVRPVVQDPEGSDPDPNGVLTCLSLSDLNL
jgi:hypothetical protein